MADKHPSSDEVKRILEDLNSQWQDLASKAQDKGDKLRQAAQQQMLNRALDDAQVGGTDDLHTGSRSRLSYNFYLG